LIEAYVKVNKFNGAVLVAGKGRVLLEKGYGQKNSQANTMNDANSIFCIYSITKSFTSTLVFKLIEQGKLSLTDPLSKFYPDFPKGDSITIEHLLTHTSGIYEYTRDGLPLGTNEASFVAFLASKPLDFAPGTGWSYSNSGYWLLGFIIQKATGVKYEEAIRQFIFIPLQMTNSGFDFKNLTNKNKTTGYALFNGTLKKEAEVYEAPGPFAAGAIYSTVGDLYKFHQALQSYRLISKESLEKAYTPSTTNKGYGYGWQLDDRFFQQKIVSHGGGAAGFRSNFSRIPKDDICVVLLNNHENANTELLTQKIYDILYGRPYKVPTEIPLDPATLAKYEGTYYCAPRQMTMYVNIEDGRLAVQVSGQPKTVALAEKENYFYAEEADGFLEFNKDETGAYRELVIYQGGQHVDCVRIYPTWGILGSATPNGWDSTEDIALTEDPKQKGLWSLKNVTLSKGEIKFRFNNDWNLNYGNNQADRLLDWFGKNIPVEAGNYDIVLDLRDALEAKCSLVKVN
jgi:CubicO group peptidase (beta-lactamase class C family)